MPTQRYKLALAYRGTRYHGWQSQPVMETYTGEPPPPGQGIPTVQETVARAIASVVGHPVRVIGSSRTDAGVHAKGQVAHFDTDQIQIPRDNLRKAANHKLPADILIRHLDKVPQTFDALHSTVRKRYQYFIWNAYDRPVFINDLAWHRFHNLDTQAMSTAAGMLAGRHDFASFARPGHGRDNTIRTVHAIDISVRLPKIVIGVEGSGFLWNMVRIMVGTLVQVGLHRVKPDDIPRMLEAHDRKAAGPTAPPHGLYLQWIETRKEDETPAPAAADEANAPPSTTPLVGPA